MVRDNCPNINVRGGQFCCPKVDQFRWPLTASFATDAPPNVGTSYLAHLIALLVGTVAGETSVVTLLDGGIVSVRGTATVGGKVYIRAGRIEGPAPAMRQNEIVV